MLKKLHLKYVRKCIICQNQKFIDWAITSYDHYLKIRPDLIYKDNPLTKQAWLLKYPFVLKQCQSCDFIFITPQFTTVKLNEIYNYESSYFAHYQNENTPAMQALKASYKVEIAKLIKYKQTGKLLDIGCNDGSLLNLLKNNFQCTGIDINKNAITIARKRLSKKVKLINSSLNESHLPRSYFDVIVMRAIIEHVQNPKLLLHEAYKLLKPNGILFLSTPNIASICGQLYRQNFRMIDPIHHIWYFSPQTINSLLTDYGFRIAAIKYNYFKTPYFKIQDLLQLGKDLLINKITNTIPQRVSPAFYGNIMDIYAYKHK